MDKIPLAPSLYVMTKKPEEAKQLSVSVKLERERQRQSQRENEIEKEKIDLIGERGGMGRGDGEGWRGTGGGIQTDEICRRGFHFTRGPHILLFSFAPILYVMTKKLEVAKQFQHFGHGRVRICANYI